MLTIEFHSMFTIVIVPQLLYYFSNMTIAVNVVNAIQKYSLMLKVECRRAFLTGSVTQTIVSTK